MPSVAAPTLTAPSDTAASRFVRVPYNILRTLDRTRVDLFMQHGDEPHVLYRDAGYPLSRDRAAGLVEQCADALFVRLSDLGKFKQDLSDALEQALGEESLDPVERFEILQFAVSVELEQALRMVGNDGFLAKTRTIGRQITELLDVGDVLPGDLFDIARHDFHTFVHVTNVAGYSVLLAKEMGIAQKHELEKIAVGALVHDIGKQQIPRSILTKSDPLTDGDWECIRQHPQQGYEELCRRDQLDHGQLMMVYQHHERVDGHGYPVGITGEEIHPWAKLLAVVDVFDAVTGDRPYRSPMTSNGALEMIERGAGTHFDKEAVRCWAQAMRQQ